MFVIWHPVLHTEVIQYKIYIKLYKNRWAGDVLAGACAQIAYKKSNIGRKMVKIIETGFLCVLKVTEPQVLAT